MFKKLGLTLENVGGTEFEQLWVVKSGAESIAKFWLPVGEEEPDPILEFARVYLEMKE